MSREIVIPWPDEGPGKAVVIPVKVSWPELQLSEAEMLANASALVNGDSPPYPDLSIIEIRIER